MRHLPGFMKGQRTPQFCQDNQAAANDDSHAVQLSDRIPQAKQSWRPSWFEEDDFRYLLYLPVEEDVLIFDNDDCMLAA